ncbi:SH3 domain-containing protein [Streptomyces niveiscabiei]|uniref:SH3 domain-containing protein n=1 Tax=Streptomyces niveiscabiei TaxID=164115 RepID=A0ABW9I889_9ACTN
MNLVTRAAVAAASTVALLAGVTATAPAASAVTPKEAGCPYWGELFPFKTTAPINLRVGPGTKHKSLGILRTGTRYSEWCVVDSYEWAYGKVTNGQNRGKWGWVSTKYLKSTRLP